MNIDHITGSITFRGGGIPVALQALLNAQVECGISARVIGWNDGGEMVNDWPAGSLIGLPHAKYFGLHAAKGMSSELSRSDSELTHLHGLWTASSFAVKSSKRPYVVSPHGMLDQWALKRSYWKKAIAGAVFERSCLRQASCLHALCPPEAEAIREYGLKNPIATIPNGVNLPDISNAPGPAPNNMNRLLFLGRLHTKKGLENALKAWSTIANREKWQFLIAGWDQDGYEDSLHELCADLALSHASIPAETFVQEPAAAESSDVVFLGPAFDDVKAQLFINSQAFILPSFSEGMPMAILEAWSYRLPVIMTEHCNIPEGFEVGAALKTGTEAEEIALTLSQFFAFSAEEQASMGDNGRQLVEERFTWPRIAEDMKDVYRWILGDGSPPKCVSQ